MNLTTTNYSLWQEHFLNLFNGSKAADEKFLSKIRNFHPETTNDCKTDEEENFTLQKKNLIKSMDAFALSLHNATFLDSTLAKRVEENLVILRDVITPTKLSTLDGNNKSEKKKSASRALQELKETIENFPDKDKSVWSSFLNKYEKHLKSIFYASRIKNCTRKKHNEYERYPYLSDLFALCKATNLSPNDVFFDTISSQLYCLNKFKDVCDFVYETTVGKDFLDTFDIKPDKHLAFKEALPLDKRFRILFFTELISSFKAQNLEISGGSFNISEKREEFKTSKEQENKKYKIYEYSLKTDDAILRLCGKLINKFGENENSPAFNYALKNIDIEDSCYFGWKFDSRTERFDFQEEFLYSENLSSWNKSNHFMMTLNFQMFYISIETIIKLHRFYYSTITQDEFIFEYFRDNPDVFPFLKRLFQLCFFYINQYCFMDWNGIIHKEENDVDECQSKNIVQATNKKTPSNLEKALWRASVEKTHNSTDIKDR